MCLLRERGMVGGRETSREKKNKAKKRQKTKTQERRQRRDCLGLDTWSPSVFMTGSSLCQKNIYFLFIFVLVLHIWVPWVPLTNVLK